MNKYRASASLAVLAIAAAVPALAMAQDAERPSLVDELVVTAQKREQSLQDVPIVVTTLSQRVLQDAGVRDLKDLIQVTPGLLVTSTANESQTVARIRGIGTVGDNPGLESSVGIVIDGVYRPRASTGIGDLGELQRVEVLKGPQGTLFGKNTSAGVINVITADPTFERSAEIVATYGNYDSRELSVSLNGPIVEDKLAGRLYVAGRKRDGFYDVITGKGGRTTDYDNNRNYWTARGSLLFTPTDTLRVRGTVDYTQRNESCCLAQFLVRGPAADALNQASGIVASPPVANKESRTVYSDRGGPNDVRDMGISVAATWETPWLNNASLTSISAFRDWRTLIGQDSDFTAADLAYRDKDHHMRTSFEFFSQELRYNGEAGNLNWMVGAFFAHEKLGQEFPLMIGNDLERFLSLRYSGGASNTYLSTLLGMPVGSVFPAGLGSNDKFEQKSDTLAFFTNNTYAFTDQLELTVGLRYTTEEKTLAAAYQNVGTGASCARLLASSISAALKGALSPAVCAAFMDPGFNSYTSTQKQSANEVTGTAKLSYRFSPDLLTYVSYARGYKSGGFNLDRARFAIGAPNPDTFFAPEFVDAYELGAKSTLFNGNVILNGALFWQDFEDFQLNTYTGISYIVDSIPKVTSRGLDMDMMWRTPIEGLSLQGGVTYAETQYGKFTPGPGVSTRLPNSRLSGAPLYSGSLSVSYDKPITGDLDFSASLNARYTSSYNSGSDLNPVKVQKEFMVLNARLGIGSSDERWKVELWGANLTDETYTQVVFDPLFQTGSYGTILSAPRTYGVTLRLNY